MSSKKPRVLSGIQPSGNLTIGNYIGAMQHFAPLQDNNDCYFMLVDMHAITVAQDPKILQEQSASAAALFLASGIDPVKSTLFMQSHVSAHAELGWILTTLTHMGELERMTQFKDKSSNKEYVGAGLFTYPSLMAADILLYDTDLVPVGDDQKQHIELTRSLANRFNSTYGQTLKIPNALIPETGARIMSLDDGTKKMSKSSLSVGSFISLLDPPDVIRKKVKKAVTDSEGVVRYDKANKPAVSNLITILSSFTGQSIEDVESQYAEAKYGVLKEAVAEAIISTLEPLQLRYKDIRESGCLDDVLSQGAEKARYVANDTLLKIKERMGFLLAK